MNKKTVILLVDDEPLIHRLFGSQLAKAGFEIIPAHDGMEGREIAMRMKPDLILLDDNMPVLSGMETLPKLRSEEVTKHIPIIFFTNNDLGIDAENAVRSMGADDYLHKGMPIGEIIKRINKVLESSGKPELPPSQ
ncbi:MAG: response regulator [Candidatus Curtissbacteria bacterium]